jgi:hypothetical protein
LASFCKNGEYNLGKIKARKVKTSLSLIKHYAMKTYEGVNVYDQVLMTSAVVGIE